MDARSAVATLASAPDVAWLGVMAGTLLIAGEFLRPGLVLVGIAGACLAVVCAAHLNGLSVAGLTLAFGLCVVGTSFRRPVVGAAAGMVITAWAARAAEVSWPAWLTSVPVLVLLTYLLSVAQRARRNKLAG